MKEKAYRPLKPEIQIRGEDQWVSQIYILGKPTLNQEKEEEKDKEALAYSPYPDEMSYLQRTTFL